MTKYVPVELVEAEKAKLTPRLGSKALGPFVATVIADLDTIISKAEPMESVNEKLRKALALVREDLREWAEAGSFDNAHMDTALRTLDHALSSTEAAEAAESPREECECGQPWPCPLNRSMGHRKRTESPRVVEGEEG